jgi:hypothetical protein
MCSRILEAPGGLRTADGAEASCCWRPEAAAPAKNETGSPQALVDDRVVVGEENPGWV